MDNRAAESDQQRQRWEREILEKLATSSIREQRKARRWGIFFKLLTFAYLTLMLVLWSPDFMGDGGMTSVAEHTALVEVSGVISSSSEASADKVITGLREAYKDKKTKGIILRINSPGGSAVQAGYINDEIRRLRAKHPDIPVYAVVTDVCASGGYYIAAAADEIYVDKASIVGSIGVLMGAFGFDKGMEKLGIERRLMTAGEHKAIMDPFSPVKEEEARHVQGMLDQIHQQFIKVVKEGRGERLQTNDKIFSGLFWSGEESVRLGLADGFGSSSYVARELVGAEDLVNFTPSEDILERLSKRIGAGAASFISSYGGLDQAPQLR